ncbi:MAG: pantoate--beta-alanine ligase [Gammaproteobacteria bacterium]
MTQLFHSLSEWRVFRKQNHFNHKTIGFAPTMGNLHDGHKSLFERSLNENDFTVTTLFVNPTQFNNQEDFKNYPKTFEKDFDLMKNTGVHYLILPTFEELYPDNFLYKIIETNFSQMLCGKHRSGHFDGVLTVVMKYFQLIKPTRAYFGEKDYQQLHLIKGMVDAFFIDTEIIGCPTIRSESNLALSSRNNRLSTEELKLAEIFPKILKQKKSCEKISEELTQLGFVVDYIEEHFGRRFGAVHLGNVRLIDNIEL